MKIVNRKTNQEMAHEWDGISEIRFNQIERNQDLSFHHILKPCILDLIKCSNKDKVLDFGCGTGNLTKEVAKYSHKVIGLDLSENSINIAQKHFGNIENLTFINSTLEEYLNKKIEDNDKFTLVISNMVLMNIVDLESELKSIKAVLQKGGEFVFTIIHPCYWSIYWNYINETWFNYKNEIFIEAPFEISLDKTNSRTTHIHRPLEQYINTLCKEGFVIKKMIEPTPKSYSMSLFPNEKRYPRFLGIKSKLV